MSTISDRIKTLVDQFADGNNSKFAKIVNTSEANVRNYIAGTQPKFDFLQSVAEKFEISCEWLLLGKEKLNCVAEPQPVYGNQNNTLLKEKDKRIDELKDQIASLQRIEKYFNDRWTQYQFEKDKFIDQRDKLIELIYELGAGERLKGII